MLDRAFGDEFYAACPTLSYLVHKFQRKEGRRRLLSDPVRHSRSCTDHILMIYVVPLLLI